MKFSMHILNFNDPRLRRKCQPLKFSEGNISDLYKELIDQMIVLMHQHNGIGLAASQVGWDARVFVVNVSNNDLVFINPKILDESGDIVEFAEGCLSFPGVFGTVDRHQKVTVEAKDVYGNSFKITDDGIVGRCLLHELDHLNGVLFIDKAKKLYRGNDPL